MGKVQNISILGCGWLGLELGKSLSTKGFTIKGSSTRWPKLSELAFSGIIPFQIDYSPFCTTTDLTDFYRCDLLVINIPLVEHPAYPNYEVEIHKAIISDINIHGVKRIIFLSSSNVYKLNDSVSHEESELDRGSSNVANLLSIEQLYINSSANVTVLRLSKVFGEGRHPSDWVDSTGTIADGLAPVNAIQRIDVIRAITKVIDNFQESNIYNLCAPEHPSRAEFYNLAFMSRELQIPEMNMAMGKWTKISSQKFRDDYDFEYLHPNPLKWFLKKALLNN